MNVLADSGFIIPKEYQSIIDSDYRKTYSRLTGFEFSGLHWNQWVAIYLNKGQEIYKNNYLAYLKIYVDDEEEEDEDLVFRPYEEGTIFLKEHFSEKKGMLEAALTSVMMIKRKPGYDSEGGDWEYLQASKDGQVIMSGNSANMLIKKQCQDCHSNMSERDYIFSTFFSPVAK